MPTHDQKSNIEPGRAIGSVRSLMVLSLVAGGIAAYLAWVGWQQSELPVGCSDSGGCAEVLRSRWASVAGVPVSLLAVVIYSVVFIATAARSQNGAVVALQFSATAIGAAAIWFVGLQLFVLRAFCPWCIAEHLIGLGVAALAWRTASDRRPACRTQPCREPPSPSAWAC